MFNHLTNPIMATKGSPLEGNNTNQTILTFSRTLTFTPDYNHYNTHIIYLYLMFNQFRIIITLINIFIGTAFGRNF